MQITMHHAVVFLLWQTVVGVIVLPLSWLAISYIIPRSLLNRYFKEPHFGPTELILLAQFPGSLTRGAMFVASIVMPKRGKKRQMTDVPDHAPVWYKRLCFAFWYGIFLGGFGSWVVLFFILLAMLPFVGE